MDPNAPDPKIAELEARNRQLEQTAAELKAKVEAIEAPELGPDEHSILKELITHERGTRYHNLEANMGWTFNRLKATLDRLKVRGFTRVEGGGELPSYVSISDAGVQHLVHKGLA
jgi:hypothetical protein